MEYILIAFVTIGVIFNFMMVYKRINNEIRVVNSKIKWCMDSIQKISKFVNMPVPPEIIEEA